METKLPIFEAKIRATDDTGIYAVSFVEVPAIEKNFVALSRAASAAKVKLKLDTQKQILTGAVLIPDMLIYRNGEGTTLGEHYLKYTADDIELIAQKMMRTGVALRNTTHQHERQLRGNYLIECWIVQDPKRDKSVALGLGEMPKGTLMASYKVRNKRYWDTQVVTGNVKGFSLEGLFNYNKVEMKKPQLTPKKAVTALGKKPSVGVAFLKSLTALLEGDSSAEADAVADEADKDETDSGTPALIFTLADGGEVEVDADGYATLEDGSTMPAGEHQLDDGNFITIDDDGKFVLTTEEAEAVEPAEAPAAVAAARQKAKDDAKALLAKQAGKKPADANAKKIAQLQAQIAELKKSPSAKPAKPAVEGGAAKLAKDAPFTDRVAAALSAKLARKNAAK